MSDVSPVSELASLVRTYGPAAARRKAALLGRIARLPRIPPREILALQSALCFLRALPDDAAVLRAVGRCAAAMRGQHRSPASLANRGVPGSRNSYPYGYPVLRGLARLFPGAVEIDWEETEDTIALEGALGLASTIGEGYGIDDERLLIEEWLARVRPARFLTDLEYVIERLERSPFSMRMRAHLYDVCGLPVRFELREPGTGLPEIHLGRKRIRYQRGEIVRERIDLAAEISRPPARLARLDRDAADALLGVSLVALAARNLEIHPLSHANPRDVALLDCGRGLEIALAGILPEYRSPLECLTFHVALVNGVPVGYGPASAFLGCLEFGFNLFPEFRGIAVRPIYAGLLRLARHHLGVRTFFLTRYGMGEENEDALRSGAFWFYRKLGFKTTNPAVEALARAEEERMRREPGVLSDRATLRRLSHTEAVLDLSGGEVKPLDFGALGLLESRAIEERFGGDRARAERVCSARIARILGAPPTLASLRRLAPLLALIPGIERWSAADRKLLARALAAKDGVSEAPSARLFARHRTLREGLLALAPPPWEVVTVDPPRGE